MTKRLASALLAALLALGCTEAGSGAPAADRAGAPAAGAPTAGADEAAAGHVVEAYNAVIGNVDRSIVDAYFRSIPEPPTADKLPRMRLTNLSAIWDLGVKEAKASLAAARQAAPTLALIGDAEAMLARAEELAEAYRAAARYYAAETFKDDGAAGAATHHEAFTAALARYEEAQRKVANALDEREQAMLERELARHQPGTISHWFRRMVVEGKVLLRGLRAGDDGAAFAAANTRLQAAVTELAAFCAKTKEPQAFAAFCGNILDNLAPRAAKIARDLRDPAAATGSPEADRDALVSYYNNMVQMVNTLLDLEGQGLLK